MQRFTALAAAAALVIGGAVGVPAAATAAPAATPASVTFKGHVTSPTGKPVAGVKVIVRVQNRTNGQSTATTRRTSTTGRYELHVPLAGRQAGSYRFEVRDTGDEDGAGGGTWAAAARTITSDASSIRVDQVVHHGAEITGRVLAGTGKPPKAGLRVYAVRQGGARATDVTWTLTRKDGTYRFGTLPAAPVEVGFYPPSSLTTVRFYTRGSAAGTTGEGASVLDLAYGKRLTGIDLLFPPVGKITGRVRIDGALPYGEGVEPVEAVLLDSTGTEVRRYDAKPLFQLRDVDPGTYFLYFPGGGGVVPEYYGDSATLEGATPITVQRNGAVTGLVADLAAQR